MHSEESSGHSWGFNLFAAVVSLITLLYALFTEQGVWDGFWVFGSLAVFLGFLYQSNRSSRRVQRLIDKVDAMASVEWEYDQNTYLHNVYGAMVRMIDKKGVSRIDVLTLLNDLNPSIQSETRQEYYQAIEKRLDEGKFAYQRVIVNRRETIGYHLSVRKDLTDHLLASLDKRSYNDIAFRAIAGGERLIDIAFALSYTGERVHHPYEMVIEIEAWSEEEKKPVFGLLKLTGGQAPMPEFRRVFEGLMARTKSNVYGLTRDLIQNSVTSASAKDDSSVLELIRDHNRRFGLGYDDVFNVEGDVEGCHKIGFEGGAIFTHPDVAEGATVKHLHVFPHGGTVLEQEVGGVPLESFVNKRVIKPSTKARAILQEYDAGTPKLAQLLVDWIARGEVVDGVDWKGGAIAFFNIPRALVDANRKNEADRLPSSRPSGFSLLASPPGREQKHEKALIRVAGEWIEGVELYISRWEPEVIVHHHTFDVFGEHDQEYDLTAFEQRPPAQVFRDSPYYEKNSPCFTEERDQWVISENLLKASVKVISEAVDDFFGGAPIKYDSPLPLPKIPFIYQPELSFLRGYEHIIYELRKDLVCGKFPENHWRTMVNRLVKVATDSPPASP